MSQMSYVHPSGSHVSERYVPDEQSECEQLPWGGALLMAVQVPDVHVSDVVHVFPHEPQFELSVWVSTHAPLQSVPVLHVHTLLMQVAPVGQTLLHMPQLFESLVVSTHIEPHIVPAQVLVLPLSCCGGGW